MKVQNNHNAPKENSFGALILPCITLISSRILQRFYGIGNQLCNELRARNGEVNSVLSEIMAAPPITIKL